MVTPLTTPTALEERLLAIAGAVPDPELPVLTLSELGVVRAVHIQDAGAVEVDLTPTYTGCPAIETMTADIEQALHAQGFDEVTVHRVLTPAWSTDDITEEGRRKLREFGIAPPRTTRTARTTGPVPVTLSMTRRDTPQEAIPCPHCASPDTELLSRFSSTACKALRRCRACLEPFDHFKEL